DYASAQRSKDRPREARAACGNRGQVRAAARAGAGPLSHRAGRGAAPGAAHRGTRLQGRLVTPLLSDEEITLARFRFALEASFDRAPGWLYEGVAKAFGANTARLAIVGEDPMLLCAEDPAKVARANKANSVAYRPALEKIAGFDINWNIVACPTLSWAKRVFARRGGRRRRRQARRGDLRRFAGRQRRS